MYNEYMEYLETKRQYNRKMFVLFLLTFPTTIVVLLTIVGVVAAPPLGIALGVVSFFFLKFYIKRCKRCWEPWKKIKEYRATHKFSKDIKDDTTYCLVVPFATHEALKMISEVLAVIGEVKSVDEHHGVLKGKVRVTLRKKRPVIFYVERNNEQCKVRACFSGMANDDWWDWFLETLFEKYPGVDFGVSLAKGDPVVAGVLNLSGDTHQVHTSVTSGGTSLGGFLIGGALFGDAGAVVGGLSGKQRTVTNSRTEYSSTLLARVIYSNGRLWEGLVYKKSQLYNEIMLLSV
jgi:hypothetical protein